MELTIGKAERVLKDRSFKKRKIEALKYPEVPREKKQFRTVQCATHQEVGTQTEEPMCVPVPLSVIVSSGKAWGKGRSRKNPSTGEIARQRHPDFKAQAHRRRRKPPKQISGGRLHSKLH